MRALLLENGQLRLDAAYPRPTPGPDEALVRVRCAGVCGTDLALIAGYKGGYRGVLGHEYVGEVVEAPGHEAWVGRRVVGEINTTCGECERCQRGLLTHCARRRVLGIMNWDGAFADFLISPISLLHEVPDSIPDEIAVFTEPLAAAYAALRDLPPDIRSRPPASVRLAIFGDGRLGQLLARVFQAEGYYPILVGRHPSKLALCQGAGIQTALQPVDVSECDVVVEATGHPDAFPQALNCVRPRGVLLLKTTAARPAPVDLSPLVVNEVRLIGSRCGPFPQALQALAEGKVDPRPLISARYPLSAGIQAITHARQPGVLKVLLCA